MSAFPAFGGAFLALVGLKFFFDADKEIDWISAVERQLKRLGNVEAIEIGLVLLALYGVGLLLPPDEAMTLIVSGIFGIITHIGVEALGDRADSSPRQRTWPARLFKSGLAAFLYLQVLDSSFSFDGVIGAFAISNNMFIIALGLAIGAMFVRSMTIMLVDKGTVGRISLSSSMAPSGRSSRWPRSCCWGRTIIFLKRSPGLSVRRLIGFSLWWSVRHNKLHPEAGEA